MLVTGGVGPKSDLGGPKSDLSGPKSDLSGPKSDLSGPKINCCTRVLKKKIDQPRVGQNKCYHYSEFIVKSTRLKKN